MLVGRLRFSSRWLRAFPSGVFAQAIAGTVRDAAGGILPDVTVQAESAALIEKVRTSVTDGSGQYRIENLRPGVYTLTFTREGFRPYVREGVQITTAFTAAVNAQLAPGPVAETITVTTATPAVDARSAGAATTLPADIVKALPTVRSYNALVVLALDAGASGFVLKVNAPTELVEAIRTVVDGGTYVSSAIAV